MPAARAAWLGALLLSNQIVRQLIPEEVVEHAGYDQGNQRRNNLRETANIRNDIADVIGVKLNLHHGQQWQNVLSTASKKRYITRLKVQDGANKMRVVPIRLNLCLVELLHAVHVLLVEVVIIDETVVLAEEILQLRPHVNRIINIALLKVADLRVHYVISVQVTYIFPPEREVHRDVEGAHQVIVDLLRNTPLECCVDVMIEVAVHLQQVGRLVRAELAEVRTHVKVRRLEPEIIHAPVHHNFTIVVEKFGYLLRVDHLAVIILPIQHVHE